MHTLRLQRQVLESLISYCAFSISWTGTEMHQRMYSFGGQCAVSVSQKQTLCFFQHTRDLSTREGSSAYPLSRTLRKLEVSKLLLGKPQCWLCVTCLVPLSVLRVPGPTSAVAKCEALWFGLQRETLLRGSGILLGDTSFRPDSLDSLGCGETAGRCSMLAN
jgi:hypothetical protein